MDVAKTDLTWASPDTITRIEKGTRISARREEGGPIYVDATEDSKTEGFAVFPDGWIGVVRADPYSVEWIDPEDVVSSTGALSLPPGFPTPPVLITPSRPLIPTPDGSLLVPLRETDAIPDSVRYDVVMRDGSRTGYLVFPASERIVGMGRESVYWVSTDDLDVQRVHRAAWPPTAR